GMKARGTIYAIADQLQNNMVQQQQIPFPTIKKLYKEESLSGFPFDTIQSPINVMEMEQANAGDGFDRIRELSDNFSVPQDACTSYRLLFDMMQAYEEDLHQHVHLENNILFPKAIDIEAATTN